MAVPFMFGPGGQPILMGQMGQIPLIAQPQQIPMPSGGHPPPQPQPPKEPAYMSEAKLQEKGKKQYSRAGIVANPRKLKYTY